MSDSIGQASMASDGTVTLRLRAGSDDGVIGEGLFVYAPGAAEYTEVVEHVGGLEPGETKPVPPWSPSAES